MASMPPGVSCAISGMFVRSQRSDTSGGTIPCSSETRIETAWRPRPSSSSVRPPAKKRNWLVR